MNYKAVIEGILFIVGDEGISLQEISNILNIGIEDVKNSLIELKNNFIQAGQYTDVVDDLLVRLISAKKKNIKIRIKK